jgi:VanZ family protein
MKVTYWLAAAGIMLVIYALSAIPHLVLYTGGLSPEWKKFIATHTYKFGKTGFFSYMISPHPNYILHKLGHIVLFGALGIVAYLAAWRSVVWALVIVAVYALSDELHQGMVVGRSGRFGDVLLDWIAAAVAIVIVRYICKKEEIKN